MPPTRKHSLSLVRPELEQLDSRDLLNSVPSSFLSTWYEESYGTNPFGLDSRVFGLSRVDATTGVHKVLYQEATPGLPSSETVSAAPAMRLGLTRDEEALIVRNHAILVRSQRGQPELVPIGTNTVEPARDDSSRLVLVNLSTGSTKTIDESREILDIGVSINNQFLVTWYDGTYGSNRFGPESATSGLSSIDPITGSETVILRETVSGLQRENSDYLYRFVDDSRMTMVLGSDGRSPFEDGRVLAYSTKPGSYATSTARLIASDGSTQTVWNQRTNISRATANKDTVLFHCQHTSAFTDSFSNTVYQVSLTGTDPVIVATNSSFGFPAPTTVRHTYELGKNPIMLGDRAVVVSQFAEPSSPERDRIRVVALNNNLTTPTTLLDANRWAIKVGKTNSGSLIFEWLKNVSPPGATTSRNYIRSISELKPDGTEVELFSEEISYPTSSSSYFSEPWPSSQLVVGDDGYVLLANGRLLLLGSNGFGVAPLILNFPNSYPDELTVLRAINQDGTIQTLVSQSRQTFDIGYMPNGSILLQWLDSEISPASGGDFVRIAAKNVLSEINPITGEETILFREELAPGPFASSNNPANLLPTRMTSLDYRGIAVTAEGIPVVTMNDFAVRQIEPETPSRDTYGRILGIYGAGQSKILVEGNRIYYLYAAVLDDIPGEQPGEQPHEIPPIEAILGDKRFSASGSNGMVTVYNPDQTVAFRFTPFEGFIGSIRSVTVDINGDGVSDIVAGTGPGVSTRLRVFDGINQTMLFDLEPFEASFTGGIFVAAGDLNADGVPDIVIAPDEGGGPRVRIFSGKDFQQIADFFGIEDPNFRGGARLAVGDLNGDNIPDLIVVAGFGGGPRIALFNGNSLRDGLLTEKLIPDFFGFETELRNGVYPAVGDTTGDGVPDLALGAGPGGAPRVSIFSGLSLMSGNTTDRFADFFAGDIENRNGVRVSVKDLDDDVYADLLTTPGSGSVISAYYAKNSFADAPPAFTLEFEGDALGGVHVG